MQEGLLLFFVVRHASSCLYQKNNPTQVGETSHLFMRMDSYHKSEIPLIAHEISHKWDDFFFHVSSFYWAVSPRPDYSFSLKSVCFCNCIVKKCNSPYKFSSAECLLVVQN